MGLVIIPLSQDPLDIWKREKLVSHSGVAALKHNIAMPPVSVRRLKKVDYPCHPVCEKTNARALCRRIQPNIG
jgi:hypothetical protein